MESTDAPDPSPKCNRRLWFEVNGIWVNHAHKRRAAMGMTVTLDRMIHTRATHHELGKEFGLGECAASGGDLSPIDLLAISLASCLLLVMAKAARKKGI